MTLHEIPRSQLLFSRVPGFVKILYPLYQILWEAFVTRGQILDPKGPTQWEIYMKQHHRRRRFDKIQAQALAVIAPLIGGITLSQDYTNIFGWIFVLWGISAVFAYNAYKKEDTLEFKMETKQEIMDLKKRVTKLEGKFDQN